MGSESISSYLKKIGIIYKIIYSFSSPEMGLSVLVLGDNSQFHPFMGISGPVCKARSNFHA